MSKPKYYFTASQLLPDSAGVNPQVHTEILLLPYGTWNGYLDPEDGKRKTFNIAEWEVDQAIAYLAKIKSKYPERDLVIDNDHLTLKDTYAPAFGWIKQFTKGPKGLIAMVDWTDLGINALKNKLYKYVSPVFFWDGIDKETGEKIPFGVSNAALTNEPFFDQLVVAKNLISLTNNKEFIMKNLIAKLVALYKLADNATEEQIIAKFDEQQTMITGLVAAKNEMLTALGLKNDASNDDVKAAIVTAKSNLTAKVELFKALGLKEDASVDEAKGLIIAAKSSAGHAGDTAARVATLEAQILNDKFNTVIAKGISTGRITPAQKDNPDWLNTQLAWAKSNFASFTDYYTAKAPMIVPLEKINVDGAHATDADVTETDVVIAKQMGLDPNKLKGKK